MILLLGGTSETAMVAQALAAAGERVLVSTATDLPLAIGNHKGITRRCGRLDRSAMAELVRRQNIRLLVDATHPYAVSARATAQQVAHDAGIPYLSYLRPSACSQSGAMHRDGLLVPTHEQAAQAACAENCPVLLTVGSRNVAVYAREAARWGVNLVVRVLDCQDAVEACRAAGIPEERIVTGRGPFGVEENRALIRRFQAAVLVTKDSGEAGGFPAKEEAARLESCRLIVVGRPPRPTGPVFEDIPTLASAALKIVLQTE